jgi:hypothetical protein
MASVNTLGLFPRGQFNPFGCPFVMSTDPVGFPVLSEKQAVQLCWRVQRWKLEFSAYSIYNWWFYNINTNQWQKFGNQNYFTSSSFDDEFWVRRKAQNGAIFISQENSHVGQIGGQSPQAIISVAENEREIQCYDQRGEYDLETPPCIVNTNFDPNWKNSIRARIPITPLYYKNINQHAMPISFGGLSLITAPVGGGIATGFFTSVGLVSANSEDYDFLGEISFLDHTIVLKFKANDYGTSIDTPPSSGPAGPSSSYGKTTSFSFKMYPSAYWPYDPNDGLGPIYNSETGERIRFDV